MRSQQHNDEMLYQEIMAELDKGAAEYDRLMASGDAPAKRKKAAVMKWYAAAASFIGLIILGTIFFTDDKETGRQQTASTVPTYEGRHLAEKEVTEQQTGKTVQPTEKTDCDLKRLTARQEIFTAMLPEVEFRPDADNGRNNDVRLPKVSKERSFDLVCQMILPEVTAFADSTTLMYSTELTMTCDEICYNDSNY